MNSISFPLLEAVTDDVIKGAGIKQWRSSEQDRMESIKQDVALTGMVVGVTMLVGVAICSGAALPAVGAGSLAVAGGGFLYCDLKNKTESYKVISELKGINDNLKKRVDVMKQSVLDLNQVNELFGASVDRFVAAGHSLSKSIDDCKEITTNLESFSGESQKQLEETKALRFTVEKLNKSLGSQLNENKQLGNKNESAQKIIELLEKRVVLLERKVVLLESQNNRLTSQLLTKV